MSNSHLARTRKMPNDEFYTIYSDIEKEVGYYTSSLVGKVVYCNCDDEGSRFRRFFTENFEQLGLSKLICSGISGLYTEFDGNTTYATTIDGDFRSNECQAVLDCADVVVTNPPFSLFNEFFSTVTEHGKDFLVIGPKTAVSYLIHQFSRCSMKDVAVLATLALTTSRLQAPQLLSFLVCPVGSPLLASRARNFSPRLPASKNMNINILTYILQSTLIIPQRFPTIIMTRLAFQSLPLRSSTQRNTSF